MSIRSLRARVTSWYVGLLAAALLVFGASLYFGFKHYLDTALEQSLSEEARNIAQTFVSEVENKGPAWLSEELSESYPSENGEHYIRISRLGPGGDYQVLYQSPDARDLFLAPPHPTTPTIRAIPSSESNRATTIRRLSYTAFPTSSLRERNTLSRRALRIPASNNCCAACWPYCSH